MKTLKNFNGKACLLVSALTITSFLTSAQEVSTPITRKLQLGILAEAQKEFSKYDDWGNPNIVDFSSGLAFRYQLSKTFRLSAGLGVSVASYGFKTRDWDGKYYNDFAPSPYEFLGDKRTETSLRLPVSIQANISKQKFFVSGGVEFFKTIDNVVTGFYRESSTNEIRKEKSNYGSASVDVQFVAGGGWNFSAIRGNSFSLEANLKYYKSLSGFTPATDCSVLTPGLRLNWYFVQ